MKILLTLTLSIILNTYATAARSPFTNIKFGEFQGRGEFIQVENEDYLDNSTINLLMAINGVATQDLIDHTRALHGENWKCRIAEFLPQTLTEMGVSVGDTVDLSIYLMNRGHQIIEVSNVPMTEDNLLFLQFETNFCR